MHYPPFVTEPHEEAHYDNVGEELAVDATR